MEAKINVFWGNGNFSAAPANEAVCCCVTGSTLDELKERMASSLPQHLAMMRADGDEIPAEFEGCYTLHYELSSQALLKSVARILSQAAISRAAGINPQLLNHYIRGKRQPRPQQRAKIVSGIRRLGHELMMVS